MNKERIIRVAVFDIDQTLAGGVVLAQTSIYNRELDLGMTIKEEQESGDSDRYPKTFDVPAIQIWREGGRYAEERFKEVRNSIRTSPEVHRNLVLLPGLPEGVMTVTTDYLMHGGYYTIRPQEVKEATHEWLLNNQLPNAEKVVICDSHEDKVRKILNDFIVGQEIVTTVVLIDDSIEQLVSAVDQLIEKEPDLQKNIEHLVLVEFGKSDGKNQYELQGFIYPNTGLRRMTLPSWEKNHVDALLKNLKI